MKSIKAVLFVLFAIWFSFASAGEIEPYTQTQFDALAAQGKPVLIFVHADWCPTCRAQKPVIEDFMKQNEFRNVTTLVIDFDGDKNLLKKYQVNQQSTLIAFKTGKEVGRTIGDTTRNGIESLIRKSVN